MVVDIRQLVFVYAVKSVSIDVVDRCGESVIVKGRRRVGGVRLSMGVGAVGYGGIRDPGC
jgi:hypothetical protein